MAAANLRVVLQLVLTDLYSCKAAASCVRCAIGVGAPGEIAQWGNLCFCSVAVQVANTSAALQSRDQCGCLCRMVCVHAATGGSAATFYHVMYSLLWLTRNRLPVC